MLKHMSREVAAVVAAACQIVVRQGARPHHFRAGFVILRIGVKDLRVFHNCAKNRLRDLIRQFHVAALREITLHRVHHNIRTAGLGLIIRQRFCQIRIHHGKAGACQIIVVGALFSGQFIRDDTAVAHLTACSRDRQNACDRETAHGTAFALEKLPHIVIRIRQRIGNCLCRINHGSAADSKEEINIVLFCEFDAFTHFSQMRVGDYSAKFNVENTCLIK